MHREDTQRISAVQIAPGSRVRVVQPRFTQGGPSVFQDAVGTVETISGRYCVVVLDDEIDELGFFIDELAIIAESC